MIINYETSPVTLWIIDLNHYREQASDYKALLSNEEKLRATTFKFQHDRDDFTIRRAIYRQILAQISGQKPTKITYFYNQFGKPSLASYPLMFNTSHSHNLAIIATTAASPLGVDLEYVRPLENWRELASSVFSDPELQAITRQPQAERLIAFYALWTKKEARAKALGHGLYIPIRDSEPSPTKTGTKWLTESLQVAPNYQATLVSCGQLPIIYKYWP